MKLCHSVSETISVSVSLGLGVIQQIPIFNTDLIFIYQTVCDKTLIQRIFNFKRTSKLLNFLMLFQPVLDNV
jgi:hypothetical protein